MKTEHNQKKKKKKINTSVISDIKCCYDKDMERDFFLSPTKTRQYIKGTGFWRAGKHFWKQIV